MDPLLYLSAIIVALALALVIVVRAYHDKISVLRERLRAVESSKQSLSTTYGRITEQWAPFMAGYPHDPRNFRFVGSPIDGIQFEDDRIVFVEIKANESRLTPGQERVKALVQAGRVEWLEFRADTREASATRAPEPQRPPSGEWGAQR